MASILRVNTLTDASSNNSIATSFVASGSAKCWVTIDADATTATVLDSFNVASLQDDAAGKYGVTYTNNMNNVDYLSNGVNSYHSTTNDFDRYIGGAQVGGTLDARRTTSQHKFGYFDSSYVDTFEAGSSVHGDLA